MWGEHDVQKYQRWYQTWIPYLLDVIPDSYDLHNKKGLEIGAGIGAVSTLLQKKGLTMTATDISNEMVTAGKKLKNGVEYKLLDILSLPAKKETYDVIVGIEVLEHLEDLDVALSSIKKLLKPGGFFIGTTPYPYEKNMSDPTHVNVHKPDYWVDLFKKHGFTDVSSRPLSCFPFLWHIHPSLNIVLPFYISLPYFVSTTVISGRLSSL